MGRNATAKKNPILLQYLGDVTNKRQKSTNQRFFSKCKLFRIQIPALKTKSLDKDLVSSVSPFHIPPYHELCATALASVP